VAGVAGGLVIGGARMTTNGVVELGCRRGGHRFVAGGAVSGGVDREDASLPARGHLAPVAADVGAGEGGRAIHEAGRAALGIEGGGNGD